MADDPAQRLVVTLRALLMHAHPDVTPSMAFQIAECLQSELFSDDALKMWGVKLTAQFDEDKA
jgi:hypothetical protein